MTAPASSEEKRRLETLRRYEELELLYQTAPVGLALIDRELRHIRINDRLAAFNGRPAAGHIGRTIHEVAPAIAPELEKHFRHIFATGQPVLNIEIHRPATPALPEEIVSLGQYYPVKTATGYVEAISVVVVDITQRKQEEQILRHARDLSDTVINSLPGVFYLYDENLKFLRWNRNFEEVTGYSPVEIATMGPLDFFTGADRELIQARIKEVFLSGSSSAEAKFRTKDGRTPTYYFTGRTTLIDGRKCLVGVGIDVSEPRRIEEELRWRTALFEAQLDAAIDGILVVDTSGKKIIQNRRMQEIWKIPREFADDKDDAAQLKYCTDRTKSPRKFVEKVQYLYAHPTEVSEDEIELVDGTMLERYSAPVWDKAGKLYGRIWTFRDITERKQLTEQLRQSQKMDAIGQLAGGVAHDFNNLLTVINGHIGLLQMKGQASPALTNSIQQIAEAANRAGNLTRQLLTFSRQEVMQPADHNLNGLVANVLKMLRRLLGEHIELEADYSMAPLPIRADEGMVEQVLLNLAVNARDAMPKGGTLRIATAPVDLTETDAQGQPQLRPGRFACLMVSDTGHGISPEILSRIFEPFFTTKEAGKGTGLGLATVYGVMQQHEGWVTVESTPGCGTTFRAYFPRLASALPATAVVQPGGIRGGHETILFVEDEEAVRILGEAALAGLGYRVLCAAAGAEALQLWQAHRHEIDLLVTDLVMPGGINGRELAERLLPDQPKMPVIYMSGYSHEVAGKDLALVEGRNYLAKPFDVAKLAATVRSNLDRSGSRKPFAS